MKTRLLRLFIAVLIGTFGSHYVRAAAGDLFVVDSSAGAIVKYNPAGTKTTFLGGFTTPTGIAFDSKGNIFVADGNPGSSTISKITPTGIKTLFASGFSIPQALAFDNSGNLFVSDTLAGTITKISPTGTKTPFASGLGAPVGLAFDKAGNLYEADNNTGQIFKFTPGGTKTPFASGLGDPFGLAFDSGGTLFVSSSNAGTVRKVSAAGTVTPFASALGAPRGIAFDSTGNLYVGDAGSPSAIYLFTPAGSKSTFAGGQGAGTGNPWFIAFDPVLHTLLNISTRAFVQGGDNTLIGGFIVGGNGLVNGTIVARAIGPSLSAFGVPTPLQDPTLELRDAAGALVAQNDDWRSSQQAQIQALGLAPSNDHESALVTTLAAGNYTAIVRGFDNTTGNALVEVYNLQ
jgi:sugar lactone lactonase YvrE